MLAENNWWADRSENIVRWHLKEHFIWFWKTKCLFSIAMKIFVVCSLSYVRLGVWARSPLCLRHYQSSQQPISRNVNTYRQNPSNRIVRLLGLRRIAWTYSSLKWERKGSKDEMHSIQNQQSEPKGRIRFKIFWSVFIWLMNNKRSTKSREKNRLSKDSANQFSLEHDKISHEVSHSTAFKNRHTNFGIKYENNTNKLLRNKEKASRSNFFSSFVIFYFIQIYISDKNRKIRKKHLFYIDRSIHLFYNVVRNLVISAVHFSFRFFYEICEQMNLSWISFLSNIERMLLHLISNYSLYLIMWEANCAPKFVWDKKIVKDTIRSIRFWSV